MDIHSEPMPPTVHIPDRILRNADLAFAAFAVGNFAFRAGNKRADRFDQTEFCQAFFDGFRRRLRRFAKACAGFYFRRRRFLRVINYLINFALLFGEICR